MSLYTIENELQAIFAEIEENGGELSEELYNKLTITKENLKSKLNNYVKAIKSWDGDIEIIKKEVKSLQATAKTRENKINRLKSAMLDAVLAYGDDGVSGNKFVELPTFRIFTKGTDSVLTDDIRISKLINAFGSVVCELVENGIIYTGQDVELQSILDTINITLKAEHESTDEAIVNIDRGSEFIPFTLTDLTTLKIEVTTTNTIYDMFRRNPEAINLFAKNPITTQLRDHTPKDDWKKAIVIAENMNSQADKDKGEALVSLPTVAKIVKNQSIQTR